MKVIEMWFKKDNKEIDYRSVNEVLGLTKKILSVLLVLVVILISWVVLMILGELEIKDNRSVHFRAGRWKRIFCFSFICLLFCC